MALVDHVFCDSAKESRSALVEFTGRVVTTTSGALGTGAANVDTPFFTLTKVAATAGRYRIQLIDSRGQPVVAPKLTEWSFGLVISGGSAYTAGKGLSQNLIRNDLLSTAGTFEIQFQSTADGTDAEVADGATICVAFQIKKGSATP